MNSVTATELAEIMGKEMRDPGVQRVLGKISAPVKVKRREDKRYHRFDDFGLEIVETGGRVSTVFLKARSRTCAEYGGEAPGRLSFSMKREEVRDALGEPDKLNGTDEEQWDKGMYRLGVKFAREGKIEFIYLSAR